ncbi:MAG: hypothetical protein V3V03_04910 [Hyphomonadaceae bacterium]
MASGNWWLSKAKGNKKITVANSDTASDIMITNIGPDPIDVFVGNENYGHVLAGASLTIQSPSEVILSLHKASEAAFGFVQI